MQCDTEEQDIKRLYDCYIKALDAKKIKSFKNTTIIGFKNIDGKIKPIYDFPKKIKNE